MHISKKPIGFWSAVVMGIGAMVGAEILQLFNQNPYIESHQRLNRFFVLMMIFILQTGGVHVRSSLIYG